MAPPAVVGGTIRGHDQAARENADLGEVLSRVQGVSVRRSGGLGSAARFSLAGLTDDQIRFFLDGLPLEMVGFSQGISNVPVNLIERIEVYRGVVPARFGADALGGAVNLVTEQGWYGTQASASYQVGSFGTHRTTAAARHRYTSGFVASASAFLDETANDYEIDVEVADERGRLVPDTVPRRHDHYRAYGAHVELGVIERPWARRLTLGGFVTQYEKDIPHNAVMTIPYGEARYGGMSLGATLRWEQPDLARSGIDVEAVAAYGWRAVDFIDKSAWVYDWYGQRIRERSIAGEMDSQPSDQTVWTHELTGRIHLNRSLTPHQELRATVAPSFTTRTGKERMLSSATTRDPLSAQRDLLSGFVGIEHEVDAWDDRFENIVLAKNYLLRAATEEVLPGEVFRDLDRTLQRVGLGDSMRWRFAPWLWGKVSYEWTTRQPRADELFGDGVLIGANLELDQETSHNGNLGLAIETSSPWAGTLTGEVTAFARIADDFIVLLGNDRYYTYQNVYAARSLGGDLVLGWTAPGEWISVDLTGTYIDLRNASNEGTFGDFEGDRIPSRPWLLATAGVTFQHRGLVLGNDSVTASVNSRYVHEFFRGWESQGLREYKQIVPSQFVHGAVLTYLVNGGVDFSLSAEVANLTDERVFDFFGVQRPGRAFSFKATIGY